MSSIAIDTNVAVELPVNVMPLTDDTDFKTREIAVAFDAAGMDLVWNFVTTAGVVTQTPVVPSDSGDYLWSHVGDAMYKIAIPASGGSAINNDAEGVGYFTGRMDGILPFRSPNFQFRSNAVNNAAATLLGRLTAARAGFIDALNGHVAQTGDSFARIGANGSGLTNLATAAALAALQTSVDGLVTGYSTRVGIATAKMYEHVQSSTAQYKVLIDTFLEDGTLVDADAIPTISVENASGVDRSANISAVTAVGTGRYEATYTVSSGDALEQLLIRVNATVGAKAFTAAVSPVVTDVVADAFTQTDRNNLLAAVTDTNELQTDFASGGRLEGLLRLAAAALGAVTVVDNGTTLTLSFKDTDGSTEVKNLTYTKATGARVQN